MKVFALAAIVITTLSVANAASQAAIHLRIHDKNWCTITNESQCNGQNWTGSTCCADPTTSAAGRTTTRTCSAAKRKMARAQTRRDYWRVVHDHQRIPVRRAKLDRQHVLRRLKLRVPLGRWQNVKRCQKKNW
ncbi:Cellulose-binding domain, fungal [Phytophthora cactorum]|nr:Cellulose-binding domain, fungal [Phytophthora cactorum]